MNKSILLLFTALFCVGNARADENLFRFGYSEADVTSKARLPDGASLPAVDFNIAGDGSSGKLRTLSAQWDFLPNLGVFYSHGNSDIFVNVIGKSTIYTGPVLGTAHTIVDTAGVEGKISPDTWFDLFGRVNFANYSVSASGTAYTGPISNIQKVSFSTNRSATSTFGSIGIRARVEEHLGAEFIYSASTKLFDKSISLGLFVQF